MNIFKLQDPFPADHIEWRIQSFGVSKTGVPWARVLAYLDNRAVQSRLDEVCGPLGWQNEFKQGPEGGVLCGISIENETEEWITKWDGADNTQVEATKGGLSGAMKRAGAQWGIGRYLYNLESNFAEVSEQRPSKQDKPLWNQHYHKDNKIQYFWKNPNLPKWALPRI